MWIEKHGPVYRIRDWAGDRKITIESGYPTKTAARVALTQIQADRLRGQDLVPRGGRVLLADWVDAWWPAYEATLKPSAAHSEGGRVRNHVLPLLGHYELNDLDGLAVQRWVSALLSGGKGRRKLAPKTVRNCHGVLHKIMGAAVAKRLIRSNPCEDTGLPRRAHKEMRFLTPPEMERLIAHTPEHWRPMVLLMLATGLRWGEAGGLRVGQLDLLAGRLTVIQNMQEKSGGGSEVIFVTPKSERSRRTVTFPASVAAELAGLVVDKDREALVFSAPLGGPPRTRNFRRTWLRTLQRAGLEGLRIHDLRHTHAAVLISAGVPLTAISRRLGHASISVTSDLYGHLMPEVDEGILAAVEAALPKIEYGGTVGAVTGDEQRRTTPNRGE